MLANALSKYNPQDVSVIGVKTFFNIVDKWRLSESEKQKLLDVASRTTYSAWKQGKVGKLSQDQLIRISLVLGIYKALHLLFNSSEQADEWMNRANDQYSGRSAREFITQGNIQSLFDLRRYLDAMRG